MIHVNNCDIFICYANLYIVCRQKLIIALSLIHIWTVYIVQAGAFYTYQDAAQFASQLEADGFYTDIRSEEHTSELQSRDSISYAVFCLKKN